MRKVFIDDLPKWENGLNKGRINWGECIGYKVKFIYDDIEGEVEIIDYISEKTNKKIKVLYKYKFYNMTTSMFLNCKFSRMLKLRNAEFLYDIGTTFKDDKKDIIIIEREYRNKNRKDGKNEKEKWYKYHCNKCGWNEGWIREYSLKNMKTCACCSNQTTVKGINDIGTTHPYLVKYFVDKNYAYTHTYGANVKTEMICPDCGNHKITLPSKIIRDGFICTKCDDGISYPNKFMINLLSQLNIEFKTEYSPEWLGQKRYDFYIPSLNLIIEMDGRFHYIDNVMSGYTKSDVRLKDKEKDIIAKNHNLNIIRIDCNYRNLNKRNEYIKQSILNSDITNYLDISNVNWDKCNDYACNSLLKSVCEYANNNPDKKTKDISEVFNLSSGTISKYIRTGIELGICNYKLRSNKIRKVEVFKDGESLGIFESPIDVQRKSEKMFNVFLSNKYVSFVCNGELKQYKGFTFKYIN